MKLIDHSYACNSLTSFEYEGHAMTGNGNHVNLLKLDFKDINFGRFGKDINFGRFGPFGTTVRQPCVNPVG